MRNCERKYRIAFGLLFLWLIFCPIASFAQPDAPTPKPAILVSFDRQTVRENDRIQVHVWLANEGEQQLTSLKLHITGPSFLKWYADNCSGEPFDQTRELGPLLINDKKSFELCLQSDSTIDVGDFNILFTFEYTWQKGDKSGRTFIATEKTLKANLLGSDTIAGVPLALAGYIVPGLFFWLVIGFFWKPPWSVEIALGEKMIYSILVSVGVIVFAGLISYGAALSGLEGLRNWMSYFDVSAGISIKKLLVLAFAGLLLGVLTGKFDAWYRKRKKEALRITAGDSPYTKLEKLLKLNPKYVALAKQRPDYCPKTTVNFKSNRQFICSLYSDNEAEVWLFGWFDITLNPQLPGVSEQMTAAYASGDLLEMIRCARDNNLVVSPSNGIEEVVGRRAQPTGESTKEILLDEVSGSIPTEDQHKGRLIQLR